jgi:hypothetical protein
MRRDIPDGLSQKTISRYCPFNPNCAGISLYLVSLNIMLLASGWRELPTHTANFDLGQTSLSALGVLGVAVEVLIIGESGFLQIESKGSDTVLLVFLLLFANIKIFRQGI